MSIDAFLIKETDAHDGMGLLRTFLISKDFTVSELRAIGKPYGLQSSLKQNERIDALVKIAQKYEECRQAILEALIRRSKTWVTFKYFANPIEKFSARDPMELLENIGEEDWYGPLTLADQSNSTWYIRPSFFSHFYRDEGHLKISEGVIRWLCFVQIRDKIVSLHWRGFSYRNVKDQISKSRMQFPYWNYIPDIFTEFERRVGVAGENCNLHNIVMHKMWDKYRDHPDYKWMDRRVRAEASGVFLSASSRGILDIALDEDDSGLRKMANSIWSAVKSKLIAEFGVLEIADDGKFSETILGAIIRRLGTISYEVELNENNDQRSRLFRGHCYFGLKPNSSGPDKFHHVKLNITGLDDLSQLDFLLNHLDENDVEGRPRPVRLL